MTPEITRWLAEIRTLQQQLVTTRQERDQAYQSAANWRQRFDTEAKQRREETTALQADISTLRTELATRDSYQEHQEGIAIDTRKVRSAISDTQTPEGLRTELIQALQMCDRLQKALEAEKAAHAETRKTLTSALGETIDAMNSSPN